MKRVLVIDDDTVTLSAINQMLKGHFRLAFCPSGAMATQVIEEVEPDLILVDLYMPEVSGIEVSQWVKGHDKYRSTPVIIHSGGDPAVESERCLAAGADLFLQKSNDADELIAAIESLLSAE